MISLLGEKGSVWKVMMIKKKSLEKRYDVSRRVVIK